MEIDSSPRGFGLPQISLSLSNLVETEVLVGDDNDDYLPSPISEEPLSDFGPVRDSKFENFTASCAADELPSWSEQFDRSRADPDSPDDFPSLSEAYDKPATDYCHISLGEANGEEIVTAVKYYAPPSESSQNLAQITNDLGHVALQSKLPRKEKNFLRRNDPRRRTISSVTGIEYQAIPTKPSATSTTPNRFQTELKVQVASPLARSSPRSSFHARSSRTPQPSPGIARSRLMETSPLPRPISGYSSPGRSSASPLPSEGSRDSPLGTRSRQKSERKPFSAIVKPSPPRVETAKDLKTKQELIKAAADKFATLPRRRPKSDEAKTAPAKQDSLKPAAKELPKLSAKPEPVRPSRRELIPSSMTSSAYSTLPRKSRTVEPPPTKVEVKRSLVRELRPTTAVRRPTLICHETETQTILYGFDLDAGATLCAKCATPDEVKSFDTRGVQVDIGARELEAQLKNAQKCADDAEAHARMIVERLNAFEGNDITVKKYLQLREDLEVKTREWQDARSLAEQARVILERERNERSVVQHELDRTSHRVAAMLDSMEGVEKEFANRGESLVHLESHLHLSTQTICRLQAELDSSQSIIAAQQRELDRSLAAQKTLLQQLQETEAEARELQEFLQAEKATMGDSLREAESEGCSLRNQISERERRIRELEDQASFIGKISEQRRLDLLGLQPQLVSRSPDGIIGEPVQPGVSSLNFLATRMEQAVNEFYSRNGIQEKSLRFEFDPSPLASRPSSQSSDGSEEFQRNPPEGQESTESSCPSQISVASSVQNLELMVEKLLKGVAFCNGEVEAKKEAAILERDQLVLNLNSAHQKLRDVQDELIRRSQVESKLRRELQGAHALISAKHSRATEDMKVIEKLSTETSVLREQLHLSGNFDDLNNPAFKLRSYRENSSDLNGNGHRGTEV